MSISGARRSLSHPPTAQTLRDHLLAAATDPDLRLLEAVGWFVSHTRARLRMTPEDIEVFQRYFPKAWQVTLVFNPVPHQPTKAGLFLRDANDNVQPEKSSREFTVTESKGLVAGQWKSSTGEVTKRYVPQRAETVTPEGVAREALPVRRWRLPAARSIFMIGVLMQFGVPIVRTPELATQPLQLRLAAGRDAVHIEWNGSSYALSDTKNATLLVEENGSTLAIELDQAALKAGTVTYLGWSKGVAVQLTVRRSYRPHYRETTGYAFFALPGREQERVPK